MTLREASNGSPMRRLENCLRSQMPKRVLLSLKPRFAEAILAGEKTFEFRRALFRQPVTRVVIYASSPMRKVVGEFTISEVLFLGIDALWKSTRHGGAIDRDYFERYFEGRSQGYALKVK